MDMWAPSGAAGFFGRGFFAVPRGEAWVVFLARATQPRERIDCRPTPPYFEVKMRRKRRIVGANRSDDLTFRYPGAFRDRHPVQRSIDRIVAAAVFENDGVPIRSHHVSQHDFAAGN